MERKKLLKNNILLLITTLFLITGFYWWWDKPIVFWVHDTAIFGSMIFKMFASIADVITFIAVVVYVYIFWQILHNKKQRLSHRWLLVANTIAITEFLKNFFKFIFGRFWPMTWQANNPSLIDNHQYGFHFFHSGIAYQSFPSGHTATVFAFATIMWLVYPKYRFIYILLCLLVPIGLIGMNYHFVSDIIGGAYLGLIVAICVYRRSNNEAH